MNSLQVDQIRQALLAIGLVQPGASDDQVVAAFNQYQVTNPAGAQTILVQNGLASNIPWLAIIGGLVGVVAVYFIWQHNSGGSKKVDAYEYPENDEKLQMHSMSNLGKRLGGGCKPLGRARMGRARMGGALKKYEFEPEIRLEGYRRKRARR